MKSGYLKMSLFNQYHKIKTINRSLQQLKHFISNAANSKKTKKSPISPPLNKQKLENLKTATGLRITANYIGWCQAHISSSDCTVLNWQCDRVMNITHNTSILDVVKMGVNIAGTIPNSDAYVIEKMANKPQSKVNTALFQTLMRQQQLTSIILTELALRDKQKGLDDCEPLESLYSMRSFAPAQLFNLFHGNEIVSATNVVETLVEQQNCDLKSIKSVSFSNDLPSQYESSDKYTKEELSQSLLLTLTFLDDLSE